MSEEIKNCPEEEKGNFDYLMEVIDWDANVDKDFAKNHFMAPKVIWENGWPVVNPGVGMLTDNVKYYL